MVDSPRPQPPLRDLKTATFAENHIFRRHLHVFENHFSVAMRRIVEAEYRQHTVHANARRVHRHKYLRLLAIFLGVWVRLAHHEQNLAAWMPNARRPPLSAID